MREQIRVKDTSDLLERKTKKALLWMNLSQEPLIVLYVLLPFILRKNLNASILQISILSSLRPILPVFSFYWSANLKNQKGHLRSNLIGAWALARLPFLFVPWITDVWYLIFCCACYELFNKSGIPALIQILKINIPMAKRESTYMLYFVLSFIESILLGLLIASLLAWDPTIWPTLLGLVALISLSSIIFQISIPISTEPQNRVKFDIPKTSLRNKILDPWKETFALLRDHPEFAKFQYGFMIGGFSLMLISPSLSIFYADSLHLSHHSVVTGRSVLMGFGIVLSSWFWKQILTKDRVPELTQWILLGFASYLFFMILSTIHLEWFYVSFFFYGVAQAGSHVLWNLSGILFSEKGDSSPFSRLNILMLGLRGAIAPALGGIFCNLFGPEPLLIFGGFICLAGALYVRLSSRLERVLTK